jgi:hypothetical protein
MYVNRKMRPVETISGRGEGKRKRMVEGGAEFKYDVFDIL